jgi:zinc transport system ATP-binding protein
MILLSCKDAAFSREGQVRIAGLNFALTSGMLVCVTGENGAGKTTLLNGILGLLPPSAGSITLAPELGSGSIGYVPQHSTAQQALPASVGEIVLSGRLGLHPRFPFYSVTDRAAAHKQLEALGLAALAKRSFAVLSGGQQRRVLLARALCAAGRLLLLDEPLAGLDAASCEQFWAILAQYTAQGGAVLMVTHDLAGAAAHADAILRLKGGKQFSFTLSEKGGAV